MKHRILIPAFWLMACAFACSQPLETFVKSFDPNPQNSFVFDKGTNIWSMGNYVYLVNGFINAQGDRTQQLFKIDASSREIVKQITMEGPQGDLAISERGGYCLTSDGHVLLTGEWRDYTATRTRTFVAKLDKDLHIDWINYYPALSDGHVFGDAIAENTSGDILLYFIEGVPALPDNPWGASSNKLRILKTDSSGLPVFNKIVADTFDQAIGYGHLSRIEDGHFLVSSSVLGHYYHPIYGTYFYNTIVHKIDEDANPVWSRVLNYCKFDRQEPVSTALPCGGGAVMWRKDTFTSDPDVAFEFSVLHRLSNTGQTLWTHEWHDVSTRTVYRIITAANGDILGCGYYSKGTEKGKAWLFRATEGGEILWERHFSDSIQRPWSPQLEMLDLCEMPDGRIAAAGIVFDTNSAGTFNPNVGLLVVDANGCLSPDCSGVNQYITGVYEPLGSTPSLPQLVCSPNPVVDAASISLPKTVDMSREGMELRCYDIRGILVYRMPWDNAAAVKQISVGQWPAGMYQLVLWQRNQPVSSGKILVQH